MKSTPLQQMENEEQPPIFGNFDTKDSKKLRFEYFFEQDSPVQLDPMFPDFSEHEAKCESEGLDFYEPTSKITYQTWNQKLRLSHDNDNQEHSDNCNSANKQEKLSIGSFLNCCSTETKKKSPTTDFLPITAHNKSQQESQKVFTEPNLKKKFHKNTNVPKLLVRIYMKYYCQFASKEQKQSLKHFTQIKNKLQARPTNNHTISDLLELLHAGSEDFEGIYAGNREVMSRIVKETMEDEVTCNNFVKDNRISYLIAMKIYAIRCRSATLAERVKFM